MPIYAENKMLAQGCKAQRFTNESVPGYEGEGSVGTQNRADVFTLLLTNTGHPTRNRQTCRPTLKTGIPERVCSTLKASISTPYFAVSRKFLGEVILRRALRYDGDAWYSNSFYFFLELRACTYLAQNNRPPHGASSSHGSEIVLQNGKVLPTP